MLQPARASMLSSSVERSLSESQPTSEAPVAVGRELYQQLLLAKSRLVYNTCTINL